MENNEFILSNSPAILPAKSIGIVGVGSYLPSKELTNDQLSFIDKPEGVDFDAVFGISARRMSEGESAAQMAVKAAKDAMDRFGFTGADIDLVITTSACIDPEYLAPPFAAYVQTKIGAVNAAAFSVDCGFNGFIPSMMTAASLIQSGFYKTVLVVSGESLLQNVDFSNFKALTIGDGAGAVIMQEVESGFGIEAIHNMSWQEPKAAGIRMRDGYKGGDKPVFSIDPFLTVEPISLMRDVPFLERYIPESLKCCFSAMDIKSDSVDKFIFGQQFAALTNAWMRNLDSDNSKNFDTLNELAALKTASIPVNLDEAYKKGIIKKGDRIALGDQGANWYISSAVIRWCI